MLVGHQFGTFYALVLLYLSKFVSNSTFMHHSRKLVQISCNKGGGTQMHKCLVGRGKFSCVCKFWRSELL